MAHIVKILEGFSFIPRKELTLLEALEQENVDMEYQCREGFCGSCQVTLVAGEVTYTTEPIAFIPEGKILTCCCQLNSDVTIEIPGGCKMKKHNL
ncbi:MULTISPECIES: class I ribonucleotide reductase maintenance protein YfaE [Gammaproteobacteria]|uniref:class I ribonucleotide reductase maintenance protein YfaE n=1 Tax=Gammaproteobacteria TaxID=1236 RepID=UPI001ADB5AB9|nr:MULTISPECIES: class I ribonucleotide reductase maintenance protein YfaE [Gammaproteobacteria]MBO9482494.1 2Fe-2S ferredoxin-like protein [Salinisphaera sp. G21_0]MBO9493101.1 2Fe-2S ferredoxin-like protein [Thalassotalea sp. G20_0]